MFLQQQLWSMTKDTTIIDGSNERNMERTLGQSVDNGMFLGERKDKILSESPPARNVW